MFVDIDDTVGQTYGYAKKGAGRSYTGIKGLNAVLAVISTPTSARSEVVEAAHIAARPRLERPDSPAAGAGNVLRPARLAGRLSRAT